MALQIRDVPEEVRDALAAQAAARSQSLQALLLALVTDEVRRADNLGLLVRFAERTDGSRLTMDEARDSADEARQQRDEVGGREGRIAR